MVAIDRNKVKLWIVPIDTAPSTLLYVAGTTALSPITGEIKSISKSGGTRDVEVDYLFGGNVNKIKPTEQVEINFDITPSLDSTSAVNGADRWDAMAYGVKNTVYTMSVDPTDKAVFMEAVNGSIYKAWGFNNAMVTVLDLEHNADDVQSLKLNLKFSPVDEAGISNFMTKAVVATALPLWSTL
jgi:hypothetical protein